jgi:hypothetical protein
MADAGVCSTRILLVVWPKKKFHAIEFPVKSELSSRVCPRKSMFAPIRIHDIPHSGTTPALLDVLSLQRETAGSRRPKKPALP